MVRTRISPKTRESLRRRERQLRRAGYSNVAGVDEAGAGPLAGPLVAAAVILPPGARLPGVFDSKRLSVAERESWAGRIRASALSWRVVSLESSRVDEIGPYEAALEAMSSAVRALDPQPDYVLVDARRLPLLEMPQEAVIRGDGKHLSIAAASIIAKVHRDALMRELDLRHPGYGFAEHKGYGTREHLQALEQLGPCPEHRRRYAPVRRLVDPQRTLFEPPPG